MCSSDSLNLAFKKNISTHEKLCDLKFNLAFFKKNISTREKLCDLKFNIAFFIIFVDNTYRYLLSKLKFYRGDSRLIYTEKVMEHFMNPKNVGELQNSNAIGVVGNSKCGDIMKLYLLIDKNLIIQEAKFKTFGCGAAIATSSVLTELITGMSIHEAVKITNEKIIQELGGLPKPKIHCSCLAAEALHAALDDFSKKNNIIIPNLRKPKNSCIYNKK